MLNKEIVKLLYVGILYGLIKANSFMNQIFGGISTTVSTGINTMKIIK